MTHQSKGVMDRPYELQEVFDVSAEIEKFRCSENVIQYIGRFTYKAFEIRSFFMEQPKNPD